MRELAEDVLKRQKAALRLTATGETPKNPTECDNERPRPGMSVDENSSIAEPDSADESGVRPTEQSSRTVMSVIPGTVYELRLLVRCERAGSHTDRRVFETAKLRLSFYDSRKRSVDPAIEGPDLQVPGLDPIEVIAIPAGADLETWLDAAFQSRYFVAPADAISAEVGLFDSEHTLLQCELVPLAIDWPAAGQQMLAHVSQACSMQASLLKKAAGGIKAKERKRMEQIIAVTSAQLQAIHGQFRFASRWPVSPERVDIPAMQDATRQRLERFKEETATPRPRIALIGTEFTYFRLLAHSEVFLLREAEWREQLASIVPDILIVETCTEPAANQWQGTLSDLRGRLDERLGAVINTVKKRGVPVHLLVTVAPEDAPNYRGIWEAADRTIIEGEANEWRTVESAANALFIRRAIEPCLTPPLRMHPAGDQILFPCASDALQFPDVRERVAWLHKLGACISEVDYNFTPQALGEILNSAERIVACHTLWNRIAMFQQASVVIMPTESLRNRSALLRIAAEAISCGAVPIFFGTRKPDARQLSFGLFAPDKVQLLELLRQFRIPWRRERMWLRLHRHVHNHATWAREDLRNLFGSPYGAGGSEPPLVTLITVSKRPQNMERIFENFRNQDYENKELVVVFNTNTRKNDFQLNENETVFSVPEYHNIGYCLNLAIKSAKGKIWIKADDDDFYSPSYISDTVAAYRATQADIVGHQSSYFYFSGKNETRSRVKLLLSKGCIFLQGRQFISGATLSGRTSAKLPRFSERYRNSCDSRWIDEAHRTGCKIYSLSNSDIVVYRDRDINNHSWKSIDFDTDTLTPYGSGNIFDRFSADEGGN